VYTAQHSSYKGKQVEHSGLFAGHSQCEIALLSAPCVCLLSGIPLFSTGSVHATKWLIKRPGYLSALQQVTGSFIASEGLEGVRGESPLCSTGGRLRKDSAGVKGAASTALHSQET